MGPIIMLLKAKKQPGKQHHFYNSIAYISKQGIGSIKKKYSAENKICKGREIDFDHKN